MRKNIRASISTVVIMIFMAMLLGSNKAPKPSSDDSVQNDALWTQTWADNFTGANGTSPDSSKWNLVTGNCIVDSNGNKLADGWGNSELENYTNSTKNVYQAGDHLVIKAQKEQTKDQFGKTFDYTSGKITTLGKFSMKYGRIDIKAKLPVGNGLWPAIWMMPADNSYGDWPASGELDITENKGRLPQEEYGTLHYGGPNNHIYTGATYTFPQGQSVNEYHVYSVEWEPGEIRWYVDGKIYQKQNNWKNYGPNNDEKYSFPAPFDKPFYLILNLAVGGTFDNGTAVDDTKLPAEMDVSYVHAYNLTGRAYKTPVEPSVVPEALPAGAKTPDANGNYLSNADFTQPVQDNAEGTLDFSDKWNFVHEAAFAGAATQSIDAINGKNYAKVDVTSPGNQNYSVQLIQKTTLGKGRWYKLTFDAKSNAARSIHEKMGGGEEAGWAGFSNDNTFNLTDQFQTFTDTFQMQSPSDILARLEFNLGAATGPVWIGNVKLQEVDAPKVDFNASKTPLNDGNLVYNGAFDKGNVDRLTYWNLTANSGAATYNVPEDTRELNVKITNPGTSADSITVDQKGIQLLKGNNYNISFDARASANRTFKVKVISQDGKTVYMPEQTVNLTTAKATQKLQFTMNNANDLNSQIVFEYGGNSSTVYLDNVFFTQGPSSDSNVIQNGSFDTDTIGWNTYFADGAAGNISSVNGKMKITESGSVGTNSYSAQVYQEGFQLQSGKTYVVSFKASADAARKMNVNIGKALNSDPWFTPYAATETVDIDSTEKQYTYAFTVTQPTDPKLKLVFEVGNVAGGNALTNIYLDDVTIRQADLATTPANIVVTDTANAVANGTFDNDMNGWNSFFGGNGGAGSVIQSNGKLKIHATGLGDSAWNGQAFTQGITLKQGKSYIVSFTANSDAARKIDVVVGNQDGSNWTPYADDKIVSVDPSEKQYVYQIDVTQPTLTNLKLGFEVGKVDASDVPTNVYIDNVSIQEVNSVATPTPIQIPTTPNLIQNGSFDTDTTGWGTYFADGAEGSISASNGKMEINETKGPGNNSYSAQIYQEGFQLESGKTYVISFKASADAARKMNVNIGKALSSSPWFTAYAATQTVDIDSTEKQYAFSFTVTQPTDPNLKLVFEVGNVTGGNAVTNIYLDDIAIQEAN